MKLRVQAHLAFVRARLAARDDRGQATAFVVGIFVALWLFAGIVVDGGLALAGKVQALDVAQGAARAGAQHLDIGRLRRTEQFRLARGEAAAAARAYVASAGYTGTVLVKGDAVTVHVVHHQRAQVLRLVGVRVLTVHAGATAHAERVVR